MATSQSLERAQHCHEAQGYLFSPPVAAEKFAPMVRQTKENVIQIATRSKER